MERALLLKTDLASKKPDDAGFSSLPVIAGVVLPADATSLSKPGIASHRRCVNTVETPKMVGFAQTPTLSVRSVKTRPIFC
jgi:hypothetical protein